MSDQECFLTVLMGYDHSSFCGPVLLSLLPSSLFRVLIEVWTSRLAGMSSLPNACLRALSAFPARFAIASKSV
jgi:hypothetical protein